MTQDKLSPKYSGRFRSRSLGAGLGVWGIAISFCCMDKQYLAGEDKAGQAKIIYQKVWSCNGLIPMV